MRRQIHSDTTDSFIIYENNGFIVEIIFSLNR